MYHHSDAAYGQIVCYTGPVATFAKSARKRLAKAELMMHLAVTANRWKSELQGSGRPVSEWSADDPLVTLCRTYQLAPAELAEVCDKIGDELEGRALRGGYDDRIESA